MSDTANPGQPTSASGPADDPAEASVAEAMHDLLGDKLPQAGQPSEADLTHPAAAGPAGDDPLAAGAGNPA